MAGWRGSSWYAGSYYNSTWYGGTGGGGANVAATGGGASVNLGLPPGWREITQKELRASAKRADNREREKRFARLRAGLDRSAPQAPVPVRVPAPNADVARFADAVLAGHDSPVDALSRMLARKDAERARQPEERRFVVGKVERRALATVAVRRVRVDVLPVSGVGSRR